MKKLQYFLMSMAVILLLGSCASDRELMVKLYDNASEQEIEDSGDYEIIFFWRRTPPLYLSCLTSLNADEKGIFHVPYPSGATDFVVVLNKEKSLIACYLVEGFRPDQGMENHRKDDLYGRQFYDVTCKDASIGEKELSKYYRKLFDDTHVSWISHVKKEYGVKKDYRFITEDRGKGEKYVAPLYIDGPNPPYSLPCREEFDDKGEMKNFFNLKD